MKRGVFLDRDGTLIEEAGYLDRLDRIRLFPYTIDAVRLLNRAGFAVFVVSNQSGAQQVYVRPLAGGGNVVQVSQEAGTEPMWGPDGREISYLATTSAGTQMMSATVRTEPELEVVSRRALFDASEFIGANPHSNYDVSPDGRSFVMVRRGAANRIVILQNLPELVRRLREAGRSGA